MKPPKQIKEYSEIKEDELDSCNLDKLQAYLKCQKLGSALKVTRHGIKAKSWVGVIKYKNLHLEILPKLISKDANHDNKISEQERNTILNNLIFMLSYTKNLDIKTNANAKLANEKNPFIELLIREFANSLFESLKRLTPKRYIREEENLNYLKGKIKFSENIRYNCANQAKFYCEYDEFSENNLLNQLFLFVSTCLYNVSNNSYNKKILKFIINYYSDIEFVRFDKFKAGKIKLTKNQELFKKPFHLAKMFVEQTSVDLSKNKFENITLVWDMNKLFEEFVYAILKRHSNLTVSAQKGRRLLKGVNNKIRNTYVDILITEPEKIVLDTKYKELESVQDFDNKDVFQVVTYCLIHNANKAVLIYPCIDNKINESYELNIDEKIFPFTQMNNLCNKKNINCHYTIKILTINLKHKLTPKTTCRIAKILAGRIIKPLN